MLYDSREMEQRAVMEAASLMCAAARTAPKAKGMDNIVTLVLTGSHTIIWIVAACLSLCAMIASYSIDENRRAMVQ